ncbi:hypothetical protein [Rhizorhabdus argentea]|uniref:hypothetical protein n=1 Tax=Rhizorhabdus argentea TaxID=1387174 RepID=UPI0030EE569A
MASVKIIALGWMVCAASLMFCPTTVMASRASPRRCVDNASVARSRSLMRHAEEAIATHKYRRANQLLDQFEATFHDPLPNPSPQHFIDDSSMILFHGKISAKQGGFRAAALSKQQALSSRLGVYDWKCGRVRNGRLSGGMIM